MSVAQILCHALFVFTTRGDTMASTAEKQTDKMTNIADGLDAIDIEMICPLF